jgi:hypothetical protein
LHPDARRRCADRIEDDAADDGAARHGDVDPDHRFAGVHMHGQANARSGPLGAIEHR